jgi:methyltransferase (TIGR00027 family)
MESGSPSRTAILTAAHRAAHFLLDPLPILNDPFARAFAGFASDEELLNSLDQFALPDFPSHRALFASRSRYTEDELAAAVQAGISQYVILGAGLDSFAYRCPDEMRSLRIYEIDHPSSQAWKRARVNELGIQPPPTLHCIPVNFERETLTQGLAEGGTDREAKAFFSWLGVTQYLTRDAVLSTLREIAFTTIPGSQLIATFPVPSAMLGHEDREILTSTAARAASVGEPWLSFFEPEEMEALLKQAGFSDMHCCGPEQINQKYLSGRTDGLRMPAYSRFIKAHVAHSG